MSVATKLSHRDLRLDGIALPSPMTSPQNSVRRIKRKPPPSLPAALGDARYPAFDPQDPFAPLSDLRRRSNSFALGDIPQSLLGHLDAATTNNHLHSQRTFYLTPDPPSLPDLRASSAISSPSKMSTATASTDFQPDHGGRPKNVHRHHHNQFYQRAHRHSVASFPDATPAAPNALGRRFRGHQSRPSSRLSWAHTPSYTQDACSGACSSSSSVRSDSLLEPDLTLSRPTSRSKLAQILVPKRSRSRSSFVLVPHTRTLEHMPPPPGYEAPVLEYADAQQFPFPSALASHVSSASFDTPCLSRSHTPPTSSDEAMDAGYHTEPDRGLEPVFPVSDPDFDGRHRRRRGSRVFSFTSRLTLRTQLDIFEFHGSSAGPDITSPTPASSPAFSERSRPTLQQLLAAADLPVIAESGVRVRFGALFEDSPTVVIFIRHFRCSACQDYMRSIASGKHAASLQKAGLKLVVIGIGSPSLIKPYKQLTGTTVDVYTDPSLTLHQILGMSLKSTHAGPASQRGDYVTHGTVGGIRRMVVNALAGKMPLWEKGGDVGQLGGEFVFGPGLSCTFAHRMTNTRSHYPIRSVIAAADMGPAKHSPNGCLTPVDDEDVWMEKRRLSWLRMRERRQSRRAGIDGDVVFDTYVPPAKERSVTITEEDQNGDDERSRDSH